MIDKRTYISLVIPYSDKEALLAEAHKRGLGISQLVRMLIKDFLAKRGGDGDKTLDISG